MHKRDRAKLSAAHGKASALATAAALEHNKAALAAAWCALSARCDGRKADYRFWFRVFESHFRPTSLNKKE
jgi:hypothetical protein